MPPAPPKPPLKQKCERPAKCDLPETASADMEEEAPTCCWHHYMAYWLARVEDEEKDCASKNEAASQDKET